MTSILRNQGKFRFHWLIATLYISFSISTDKDSAQRIALHCFLLFSLSSSNLDGWCLQLLWLAYPRNGWAENNCQKVSEFQGCLHAEWEFWVPFSFAIRLQGLPKLIINYAVEVDSRLDLLALVVLFRQELIEILFHQSEAISSCILMGGAGVSESEVALRKTLELVLGGIMTDSFLLQADLGNVGPSFHF